MVIAKIYVSFGNAKELVLNYLDILKVSVVITGMIICTLADATQKCSR